MAMKRKRVYAPRRSVRRKGGFRKRRSARRGGGRTKSLTSKSSTGANLSLFRARRLSKGNYRHLLWNDTLFKNHYRSASATSGALSTIANAAQMRVDFTTALQFGGAVEQDGGVLTFFASESIVIRGGIIKFSLFNPVLTTTASDVLKGIIFLVKTSKDFDSAFIPTAATVAWDPSVQARFKDKVGHIIMQREFMLEDGNSSELSFRLPIQSVDNAALAVAAKTYVWIFCTNAMDGAARQFNYVASYNLSFCGDAIGTL